jgi:hypothetical protein
MLKYLLNNHYYASFMENDVKDACFFYSYFENYRHLLPYCSCRIEHFRYKLNYKKMGDNKKRTGEPDRSRISTSERYEMDYWKEKFDVSSQQLTGAVRAVGNNAKEVEKYLRDKQKGK